LPHLLDEMEGLAGRLSEMALLKSRRFGALVECLHDLFPNDDEPLLDRTTDRAFRMTAAPDRNPFRLADEDLGRLVAQRQPSWSLAFADAWSVAAVAPSDTQDPVEPPTQEDAPLLLLSEAAASPTATSRAAPAAEGGGTADDHPADSCISQTHQDIGART